MARTGRGNTTSERGHVHGASPAPLHRRYQHAVQSPAALLAAAGLGSVIEGYLDPIHYSWGYQPHAGIDYSTAPAGQAVRAPVGGRIDPRLTGRYQIALSEPNGSDLIFEHVYPAKRRGTIGAGALLGRSVPDAYGGHLKYGDTLPGAGYTQYEEFGPHVHVQAERPGFSLLNWWRPSQTLNPTTEIAYAEGLHSGASPTTAGWNDRANDSHASGSGDTSAAAGLAGGWSGDTAIATKTHKTKAPTYHGPEPFGTGGIFGQGGWIDQQLGYNAAGENTNPLNPEAAGEHVGKAAGTAAHKAASVALPALGQGFIRILPAIIVIVVFILIVRLLLHVGGH